MKQTIEGQLEIDFDRGVIYFHASEGPLAGGTILRISSLPNPIPTDKQLDITHLLGTNWDRLKVPKRKHDYTFKDDR